MLTGRQRQLWNCFFERGKPSTQFVEVDGEGFMVSITRSDRPGLLGLVEEEVKAQITV
jgi:hypothetical protein